MNESQVVAALLQFYKRQGIDLHYVLDDPVFDKLPLQAKIEAIKTHAAEIVEGTRPGIGKAERGSILTRALTLGAKGGVTGAALGASLGAVARGAKPYMPAAIGAVSGFAAGVANGLLEARQSVAAKRAVRDQLHAVSQDPSDTNALGALSIRGIHARQSANMDEVYALLRGAAERGAKAETIAPIIERNILLEQAARQL